LFQKSRKANACAIIQNGTTAAEIGTVNTIQSVVAAKV
jgi:hypothetical protein